jgi:hypothetical protein
MSKAELKEATAHIRGTRNSTIDGNRRESSCNIERKKERRL